MSKKSCDTCADLGKASCAECDECHQWRPRITRREEEKLLSQAAERHYYVVEEIGAKTEEKLKVYSREESYKEAANVAVEMARRNKKNYFILETRAVAKPLSEHIVALDEIPLWMDH